MWRKVGLCIFFVLLLQSIQAQIVSVKDKFTGAPIAQATIQELETDKGAITDSQGRAELKGFIKSGTLLIRHPAYRPRQISFQKLEASNFTILLTEEIFTMDDVVVSANKWEQNKVEIPQQIADFSREAIAKIEPATTADLLNSSGEVFIQKSQLGGGSPMIRGFAESVRPCRACSHLR